MLWRLARAVPEVTVCAYVDDLNLVLGTRADLLRTVYFLREFEEHFSLSLSEAKTHIWATDERSHVELSHATGFRAEKSLNALGAEWPTSKTAKLKSLKELARLDECMARLTRAKALPLPAPKLALVVSIGCLSLLDFVNLAEPKPYLKLRNMVKDVFDLRAGAPEVVSCLLIRGSLDPQDRWLMSIMRIWHHVLQQHPSKEYVDEVIEQAKRRLGKGAVHAFRWGITVSCDGFQVGTRLLPSREQWFVARKVLMAHLKGEHARRLAERRPLLFEGLATWNHKQHNRLLMMVTPYERKVMLRLWTGSSMYQHKRALKRHQVYGESSKCCEDQSLWHLLWQCPCVPPPPIALEYRKHLPRAQLVAHLLPEKADRAEVILWRQSCKRAVVVLSMNLSGEPRQREEVDTKGHEVAANPKGTYVFCKKCFICRRVRDKKWIWTKPCRLAENEPRALGEAWACDGHEITLSMGRWKTTAERPLFTCSLCGVQVWATSGFKLPCPAIG